MVENPLCDAENIPLERSLSTSSTQLVMHKNASKHGVNSKHFFSQLINFLMEVADEQNNQVGEASYEQPGSTKK